METIDPAVGPPPEGVTHQQPRCGKCRRFARLLPGDTECARCFGALALDFPTIANPVDATGRGGW
jgi:hypothetical protein